MYLVWTKRKVARSPRDERCGRNVVRTIDYVPKHGFRRTITDKLKSLSIAWHSVAIWSQSRLQDYSNLAYDSEWSARRWPSDFFDIQVKAFAQSQQIPVSIVDSPPKRKLHTHKTSSYKHKLGRHGKRRDALPFCSIRVCNNCSFSI